MPIGSPAASPTAPNKFRPVAQTPIVPGGPVAPPIAKGATQRQQPMTAVDGADQFRPATSPDAAPQFDPMGQMAGFRSIAPQDQAAPTMLAPTGQTPDAMLMRGPGGPVGSAQSPPPEMADSSGSLMFRRAPFRQIKSTSMAGTSFPPGIPSGLPRF